MSVTAPILYLAPVEWTSLWQRPQQLALGLSRRHCLSYVEPVGLRSLRPRDFPRVWRRIFGARPAAGPVPVIRPKYLPLASWRAVQGVNRMLLLSQLRRAVRLDEEPWILWIGAPSLLAETVLRETRPTVTVYDCMDHYAEFHRGQDRRRIIETEQFILQQADCVLASSSQLLIDLRRHNRGATLLPNGVEFGRFCIAEQPPLPAALRGIKRPILGFHGTLGPWLDYSTLETIALRRPDWSLVLAGPKCAARASRLIALPNVHHLGVIEYDKLPALAAHYDVALVPFIINELTRCVHPIKALEYLALGLPTVSARLPDLMANGDVFQFATTSAEWIDAISGCLASAARAPQAIAARREIARGQSWDHRIGQVEETLDAALSTAAPPFGQHDSRQNRRIAA